MGGPAGIQPNDDADELNLCEECGQLTYRLWRCFACDTAKEKEDADERDSEWRKGK